MATTIITKNGSGAPLAGDLTAGELAVDLTNKRLYSKDSGGTVIELGTNAGSSTFADLTVSGDLTVDTNTLYVDSTNNRVGVNTAVPSAPLHVKDDNYLKVIVQDVAGVDTPFSIGSGTSGSTISNNTFANTSDEAITLNSTNQAILMCTAGFERMTINSSGKVGIGHSSPVAKLAVLGSSNDTIAEANANLCVEGGGGNGIIFGTQASSPFRSYIQSGFVDDFSLAKYDLTLNPLGGKVGIGTDSPSSILHVYNGVDAGEQVIIGEVSGGFSNAAGVSLRRSGTEMGRINASYFDGMTFHATTGSGGAATERMRIDTSGDLPHGTITAASSSSVTSVQAKAGAVYHQFSNTSGSTGAVLGVNATGDFEFYVITGAVGSESYVSPEMVLDASGNLLVGQTTASLSTNGLAVESDGRIITTTTNEIPVVLNKLNTGTQNMIHFYVNTVNAGYINASGGGTPAFGSASDIRLKENVIDHESELANVMALRPVRWDWIDNEWGSGEGFVAQELEQTAWADLVSEGDDGYKQVAGLGAVETRLIKAIQEQQAMIETLQAQVAELQGAN